MKRNTSVEHPTLSDMHDYGPPLEGSQTLRQAWAQPRGHMHRAHHCPSSASLISWTTSPLLTDSSWGPALSQSATTVYFPGTCKESKTVSRRAIGSLVPPRNRVMTSPASSPTRPRGRSSGAPRCWSSRRSPLRRPPKARPCSSLLMEGGDGQRHLQECFSGEAQSRIPKNASKKAPTALRSLHTRSKFARRFKTSWTQFKANFLWSESSCYFVACV